LNKLALVKTVRSEREPLMSKEAIFSKVLQIAVVVEDLDSSVKKWADEYGVGPWVIFALNSDKVDNMSVRGRRVDYAMKIGLANVGDIEIELIEPLDERSIYAEFLAEHGEGIHHLAFETPDYKSTVDFFERKGIGVYQSGSWSNETFAYFDTRKDLGLITELYKREEGNFVTPRPDRVYPKSGKEEE
jgi:methylmalonyl-CoA/ethylmalonyl-CoA epimerase